MDDEKVLKLADMLTKRGFATSKSEGVRKARNIIATEQKMAAQFKSDSDVISNKLKKKMGKSNVSSEHDLVNDLVKNFTNSNKIAQKNTLPKKTPDNKVKNSYIENVMKQMPIKEQEKEGRPNLKEPTVSEIMSGKFDSQILDLKQVMDTQQNIISHNELENKQKDPVQEENIQAKQDEYNIQKSEVVNMVHFEEQKMKKSVFTEPNENVNKARSVFDTETLNQNRTNNHIANKQEKKESEMKIFKNPIEKIDLADYFKF